MSLKCAERELELSHEQRISALVALAQIYRGWALARLGRHEEALATIPRGIADYRAPARDGGTALSGPAGRGATARRDRPMKALACWPRRSP